MVQKVTEKFVWSGIWYSAVLLLVIQMCVFWVGSEQNDISWNLIAVIFVLLGILGAFASYKVKGKIHGFIFFVLCVASGLVCGIEQLRIFLPSLGIGHGQPPLVIMIIFFSEGTAYTIARYTYKCKAFSVPSKWYKRWEVELGAICGIACSALLWILFKDFGFSLIFFALGVFSGIYGLYFEIDFRKRAPLENEKRCAQ